MSVTFYITVIAYSMCLSFSHNYHFVAGCYLVYMVYF